MHHSPPAGEVGLEQREFERFLATEVHGRDGWKVRPAGDGAVQVLAPGRAPARFVTAFHGVAALESRLRRLRKMGWKPRLSPTEAVEQVLADMPDAARQVHGRACLVARRAQNRKNVPGLVWRGDVFFLLRLIWPYIPDVSSHPDNTTLRTHLLPFLATQGVLVPLTHHAGGNSEWWLPVELPERLQGPAPVTDEAAPARETPPVTEQPTPAPLDADTDPMKIYACAHSCGFADASQQAVRVHEQRTKAPHPTDEGGPFRCPEKKCHASRPTIETLITHLRGPRGHAKRGSICRHAGCLRWFTSERDLNAHFTETGHGNPADRRRTPPPRRAAAPPAESPPVPAPRPALPPPGSALEDAARAVAAYADRQAADLRRELEMTKAERDQALDRIRELEEEAARLRHFTKAITDAAEQMRGNRR